MSMVAARGSGGEKSARPSRRRRRVVFVIGANPVERERVAEVVRKVADEVRRCDALGDVDLGIVSASASVLVLAPDATASPTLVAAIRRFRAEDPATSIVMCVRAHSRTPHVLARLARAGLDELTFIDQPDTAERLTREVGRRLASALPVALVRAVLPRTDHDAETYCAWCYRNAYRRLHVDSVADWFRENRKTVNRHLQAAALPPVHELISKARLLHTANRLDTSRSSIETSARLLEFGSASALAMFVKRQTRRSPSELRARGAQACEVTCRHKNQTALDSATRMRMASCPHGPPKPVGNFIFRLDARDNSWYMRGHGGRALSLGCLLLLPALSVGQSRPELRLRPATARLDESFTNIVAIRELSDGRVLVAEEPRDIRLIAADFRHNRVTQVGGLGDGPGEYRSVYTLLALGRDSTLLVDWQAGKWTFFDGLRAVASRSTVFVPNGDRISRFLFGADSLGRVLEVRSHRYRRSHDGRPVGRTRDNADSLIVLLHHRAGIRVTDRPTTRVDTLARVRGSAARQTEAVREAVPGSPVVWILNSPFASEEQSLLFRDGWIVLLLMHPYRVEWIAPYGARGAVTALPDAQVRMDDRQVRAAIARKWPRVRPQFRPDEIPPSPTVLPPFGNNALHALPDGRVLIRRTYDANYPGTFYDIVNRRGQLVERLALGPNERVVGFGVRSVYVATRDADDVEHLSQHPWP